MKTNDNNFKKEVIALSPKAVNTSYLKWVNQETK